MAYDEHLADRIRDLIGIDPTVTEKKMFGGLAFLVDGHMAISASGQGGVLVHVDPAATEALLARSKAEIAIMRGRPMNGWLRVASEHLKTKAQLAKWVDIGVANARAQPSKPARANKR